MAFPTLDAHQHFWRISRGDYGWMDENVAAIRRDILPTDLEELLHANGIEGTVLVQAAPTVDETLFLLDLADRTSWIRAVVGWIDLERDAEAQLARIAHPKLRGIRPMLQDIDDTDWVLQPSVVEGLGHVAEAGLGMDALVTPRHLGVIDRLAGAVPDLPIVVDHCAKPNFNGSDPGEAWRDGMAALAGHPQIMCKISGLANEYGPGWSTEGLRPVFDHVLSVFRPKRMMWGSDWPVLELAGRYSDWFSTAGMLASDLTSEDRADLFGRTAARFYGLDL